LLLLVRCLLERCENPRNPTGPSSSIPNQREREREIERERRQGPER